MLIPIIVVLTNFLEIIKIFLEVQAGAILWIPVAIKTLSLFPAAEVAVVTMTVIIGMLLRVLESTWSLILPLCLFCR